jgi:transcriptional regulator with XRE-family HTH domain
MNETVSSEPDDGNEGADSEPSPIGEWLRAERAARNWSQQQLASRSGVSKGQIGNLEVGRNRNPQARTREKLERALGVRVPAVVAEEAEREAQVLGLGALIDFDPHEDADLPRVPGIYVFYDISDRPIYVGKAADIRARVSNHHDKFWFKSPIVTHAAYIEIADDPLRTQVEQVLIKFLKSNAVLNKQHVDR